MVTFSFPSSFVDPSRSARPSVDWAIAHQFHGVELNGSHVPLDELSDGDRRYLRIQAAVHGITYTHHFTSTAAPGSHDDDRRSRDLEDLRTAVRTAAEIGVKVIVLHPGKLDVPGMDPESTPEQERHEALDHLVGFLGAAAPLAEDLGISLCLENMHHNPGWVVQSYEELLEVVTRVDSPMVAVTFDLGHAWGAGGMEGGLGILKPHIRHLHFHDCRGPEGAGIVADQHLEIGTGVLEFPTYRDFVASYPFVVTLETEDDADPCGCLLRSRAALRAAWGELAD